MPTLSVIMIVKDEAARLGECLDSVRSIADEIVVVDTGSTDDTMAIADGRGAQVYSIPWKDDFAEARNRSIDAATGDWLLHMDADEVLDEEGAKRIRSLVDGDGQGADAIEVTLANYCDEPRAWRWMPAEAGNACTRGHSGYIATGLLRLFRNGRGFVYREPVHENITESVLERGGVVRTEPIVIHHYGYDPRDSRTGKKAALYLDIARKKLAEAPEDLKALQDYAEQALACNLTAEAEEACRKALSLEPNHLSCATTLSNILLNRGDYGEAREILLGLEAGGIAPPHVVTALGAIACHEGMLEEARERLEAVVQKAPGNPMARQYLARAYDRSGQPRLARVQLYEAAGRVPTIQEFQDRLQAHDLREEGEGFADGARWQEALSRLVQAVRLDPDDPLIHNALGVVLAALGEKVRAKESFERALERAPGLVEAEENLQGLGREA